MNGTYVTSASNAITIRIRLPHKPGSLAQVTAAIGDRGGNIGAIDIVRVEKNALLRDITVETGGEAHTREILATLDGLPDIEVVNVSDRTFLLHLGGKIEMRSKHPIKTRAQLSMAYTPGVARVCMAIAEDPDKAFNLTIKHNMIAVVTDGTAVLGLGDIGPEAAMPVMEGKAQLFKDFAGVDAFPICLATKEVEAIIETVERIAPGFGGINLEDISAPRCFEIERRLKKSLNIPVFHDDQHGTAVVMVGAMINALKITNRKFEDLKVVMAGVGAAGTACTDMLLNLGVRDIVGYDRKGALVASRTDLNPEKRRYAERTNPDHIEGSLHEGMAGADVFIGLSGPGLIHVDDLKRMAPDPIVFAMANPTPEIMPEEATPYVSVMATGRSDYPNQINNVLCFPGMFKGALACRASDINEEMKVAAAYAIAESVDEDVLTADYIVPSVFDKSTVRRVSEAVKQAAINTGVARKQV